MYRLIVYLIMSYQQKSIKSIIDKINLNYFIPDIQRNYVWLQNPKAKKIEQLFDSLMRGYPIGAFLFWKLSKNDIENDFDNDVINNKLNFQLYKFIENYDVRKPNNEKINISKITGDELNIVLDGQQRLTSLYIGLRGSRTLKRPYARANDPNPYVETNLYLNLSHKPKDDTPDDRYMFEFLKKEDTIKNTNNAIWFKVGKVLDFNNKDDVRSYCRSKGYSQEAIDIVEDLWGVVVKDESVISFFEETEKNLDKVLKIFIRVNSGGMQLSYSDLLMSLLTATFKSDIRDQMEQVVEHMKDNGFACFSRDQILKTCMMLSDCNHVFKMENFSKANIRKIENNWDSTVKYLYEATAILKSMGYENYLSSGYIIAVLTLYIKKKNAKVSKQDKDAMASFVRIAQMRSYFTTSLDTKLSLIKEILSNTNDFDTFVLELEKKQPDFKIDVTYLEWAVENVEYGSPAALPLLQLLYPNLNYGSVIFHIDHIYPKSKFNKKTEGLPQKYIGMKNGIWNLQLLEGRANQSKNDKDPEEWLKEEMPDATKRKDYLISNYIPEDFILDWSNLEEFESERKRMILEKLMRVFNLSSSTHAISDSNYIHSEENDLNNPTTNIVIVDYTERYTSFGWKGSIHMEIDIQNKTIKTNGWDGPAAKPISSNEEKRYIQFFSDVKNLNVFFDSKKAYDTPLDTRFEHHTCYSLRIEWNGRTKEIKVGYPDIPFKHPFN